MITQVYDKNVKFYPTGRMWAQIPTQDPSFGPWKDATEFETWWDDNIGETVLPGTIIGIHDNSNIAENAVVDDRPIKSILRFDGSKWNAVVTDDIVTPAQYGCVSETDDLGAAINAAIADGRYNIFIPKGNYSMKTTVTLPAYDFQTTKVVRIFGNFDRVYNMYEASPEAINVKTPTGVAFMSDKDSDGQFARTKVVFENLAFWFDRSGTQQTITNCYPTANQYDFFRGVAVQSTFHKLFVQCCDTFIHGALRQNTQISQCNVRGVVKTVFSGPIYDSKINNNSFNAAANTGGESNSKKFNIARSAGGKELIQPAFVFSGYRDGKGALQNGGIVGTTFDSNYVDYFHFVFLTMDGTDYAIKTQNNTFDIFRYLITTCKLNADRTSFIGFNHDNIITLEPQRGINYSSLNDEFLRCNNYDLSNSESTDYHLNIDHKTIKVTGKIMRFANAQATDYTSIDTADSSIDYPEIYSILGCAIVNGQYQIKSVFRPSVEYIINCTSVRISGLNADGTAHYASAKLLNGVPYIEPATTLSINRRTYTDTDGHQSYYGGWEISGGSPSMYKFTSVAVNSNVGEANEGAAQSAPVRFLDLMDSPVEELVDISVKGDHATYSEINAALNQLDCKFPGRTVRFHGLTYTFTPSSTGYSVDKVKSGTGSIGHWLDNNSLAEFVNSGYDWDDKLKTLELNSSNYSTGLMIGYQLNKDEGTDTVRGAVQLPNATAPSTGDSGTVGLMLPDDKAQVTKVKNAVSAIGDTTDGDALAKVSAIKTYVGSEINAAKLDPSSSITVDSTVKSGSGNPVSGGAVYSSINSVSTKVSALETKMANADKEFIVKPASQVSTFMDEGNGLKLQLESYNFGVAPGVSSEFEVTIPYATSTDAGVVKVDSGSGLTVSSDGSLSVQVDSLVNDTSGGLDSDGGLHLNYYGIAMNLGLDNPTIASSTTLGNVKIGSGISIDTDGTISVDVPTSYSLPTATATRLGGVKIGEGVHVANDGTISVDVPSDYLLASPTSPGGDVNFIYSSEYNGLTLHTDVYNLNPQTSAGQTGSGSVDIVIPVATRETPGVVKAGDGIDVAGDGTISVVNSTAETYSVWLSHTPNPVLKVQDALSDEYARVVINIPIATPNQYSLASDNFGLTRAAGTHGITINESDLELAINVGSGLSIDSDGKLNLDSSYLTDWSSNDTFWNPDNYEDNGTNLVMNKVDSSNNEVDQIPVPYASASKAGVVKVGTGLSISNNGTLNCTVSVPNITRTTQGGTSTTATITDTSTEAGYAQVLGSAGPVFYATTDLDNSMTKADWLVTVKGLKKFLKEHIRIEDNTLVFDF